jgi:hypothetical protein
MRVAEFGLFQTVPLNCWGFVEDAVSPVGCGLLRHPSSLLRKSVRALVGKKRILFFYHAVFIYCFIKLRWRHVENYQGAC